MVKIITLIAFFVFSYPAYADTLYLKNGNKIQGLIKREDLDIVELEVCIDGAVKFKKSEIEKIYKSSPEEAGLIRAKWEKQRIDAEARILERQAEEEHVPRKVEFTHQGQSIVIQAILNKKAEVSLVLDTGATIIMLRRDTAKKLKIDLKKVEPDLKLTMADGRQVYARRIILESVKVESVEANDVEACVLLEELGDLAIGDGLLGMSFLKRFNFKIDQKNKKLTLEKL